MIKFVDTGRLKKAFADLSFSDGLGCGGWCGDTVRAIGYNGVFG